MIGDLIVVIILFAMTKRRISSKKLLNYVSVVFPPLDKISFRFRRIFLGTSVNYRGACGDRVPPCIRLSAT
jgi:hypothetical protein